MSKFAILVLCGAASALAQPAQSLGSVEGQVIDIATGAPIRKAVLTLSRKDKRDVRTATSDTAGSFSFSNLPAGAYSLAAGARGYLTLTENNAPQPRRSGTFFSLDAGRQLSGITLRLRRTSALSGRIVDEDEDPVDGVEVQLWRVTYRNGIRQFAAEFDRKANTDERGTYRIAGITPGRYYLSARTAVYPRSFYPATFDPTSATPIDLSSGAELENISIKLSKVQTVRVSGQVLSATPANVILYPDNIVPSGDISLITPTTPPDGKFAFDTVVPGAYTILVKTLEGLQSQSAQRSILAGPSGVDGLTMSPVPAIPISGRVRVDGGTAMDLSKMRIHFKPMFLTYYDSDTVAVTKDGAFKSENREPGRYALSSTSPGLYLKSIRSGNRDLSGSIVDTSAAAQLEVLLSPKGATVTGAVSLPDSDRPASEVAVVLIAADQSVYPKAMTDESGKFAIRDIPPGEYRAFAWASVDPNHIYMDPDFIRPLESKGVAVTLTEGGQADIKLTLISEE